MKKKLLLTGASGFLGFHLLQAAINEYDIFGIINSTSLVFRNAAIIKCNLTNYIDIRNLFKDIEPNVVIHAAALSDANFCEQNKELSYAVNVEATKNIAGICSDYNVPFIFTSTDLVFDGKKGMYVEGDKKNPLNIYGEQKSTAEEKILRIYPSSAIFRLPLMFGLPNASASNYLQKFILQIQNKEPVKLFFDEYRSICGARSIAEGILKLLNEKGIIHLAGKEKLSRYDFGMKATKAFNLSGKLIDRCSQKDINMAAVRPADVSLNIAKAISLGYQPLSVDEELKLITIGKYF